MGMAGASEGRCGTGSGLKGYGWYGLVAVRWGVGCCESVGGSGRGHARVSACLRGLREGGCAAGHDHPLREFANRVPVIERAVPTATRLTWGFSQAET